MKTGAWKKPRIIIGLFVIVMLVVAWWVQPQFSTANQGVGLNGPVITQLVGRNEVIRVVAGPDGPLYTVITPGGQVIVEPKSIEQLKSEHPEWYRKIYSSLSGDSSYQDASAQIDDSTFLPY